MKAVITGASGVLGRATLAVFQGAASFDEVKGLAFSRSSDALIKLDLLDETAVETFLSEFKPDVVVHCAAERRPDVADKDPSKARQINAAVPLHLSKLAAQLNFRLIYISTDYVFPGTNPPYETTDKPEPLNFYGVTKREGEVAVLDHSAGKGIVLRVPILYGETEYDNETAVNCLVPIVLERSGKTYTMDAYQTRYPTAVVDVARAILQLVEHFPASRSFPAPAIMHYSASEAMTKADMCRFIAKALGVPGSEDGLPGHIKEDKSVPAAGVVRPQNTELSMKCWADNGMEWKQEGTFESWWTRYLASRG